MSEDFQVTQRNAGCPEPGLLAAHAEGRLSGREAARLDQHIAGCADCYEVFSETLRFTLAEAEAGEGAPDTPPLWRRPRLELIAGFAVAAVVLVALPLTVFRTPPGAEGSLVAELASAMGPRRFVEPRLSGGFQYGRLERFRSADVPRGLDAQPPAVLGAVARIRERAENDPSPEALGALAVTYLVSGDVSAAVEALEDATAQKPHDPRLLSDLAAAYLARAAQLDEAADIPRGLEAAEEAIALPDAPVEAWFNRALALESLHLRDAARNAWRDYLERDTEPGWAEEAQEHLAGLPEARLPSAEEDAARVRTALAEGSAATERLGEEAPQLLRSYLLDELLPAWADAYLAGEADADRYVERARLIGDALARSTGDALPRDAARALAIASNLRSQALGYRTLHEANELYDAQESSCSSFREARGQLHDGGSPYEAWARLRTVSACLYPSNAQAALSELDSLDSLTGRRKYAHLQGLVRWMKGLVHVLRAKLVASLDSYRSAKALFQDTRDAESEAWILGSIAENLLVLGEGRRAWPDRWRALALLAEVKDPRRRHGILSEALHAALDESMPRTALHFGAGLAGAAESWGNAVAASGALATRAAVRHKLAKSDLAAADLEKARSWASLLVDRAWSEGVNAELDAIEGEILLARQPEKAARTLERSLAYFRGAAPVRVPALQLLLARAHAARGRTDEAEVALLSGIEAMERDRVSLRDVRLQLSFFEQSLPLFADMIRLQVAKRDRPERALAFVERAYARQLADALAGAAGSPLTPETLQQELPEGLSLVYYFPLEEALYSWTLSREGLHFIERPLPANELSQLVAAHRTAIERRAPLGVVRQAAARLHDELVRPFIPSLASQRALVFVAHGVLESVAFAALWDRETGRYLVEDRLIGAAPSGTVLVAASSKATPLTAPRALVVGNPAVNRSVWKGLSNLPGAEAEAREVARLYARSELLSGAAATKEAFLAGIQHYDVVHFAGHAVARGNDPSSARLMLSAEPAVGDSGALYLNELGEASLLGPRVVVLAACRTAAGTGSRVEGVVNVSRPFLAAGVAHVVASIWDIDDAVSRRFFVVFHRALLVHGDAARALRDTQLSLLHGNDSRLAHPASWAPFICLGGLDPHS